MSAPVRDKATGADVRRYGLPGHLWEGYYSVELDGRFIGFVRWDRGAQVGAPVVVHRAQLRPRHYRVSVAGETVGYVYPDGPAHWCAEDVNGDRWRVSSRRAGVNLLVGLR